MRSLRADPCATWCVRKRWRRRNLPWRARAPKLCPPPPPSSCNEMPMSPSILLYLLAAMTATPSTVTKGPSFDCKLAKRAVEKLICADPELSDMDRRMGLLYAEARRERPGEVPAIDKEQIAWLKERTACDEVSCLRISYSGRSGDLVGAMPVLERATDI